MINRYLVFNIGCIECGVSSNVVGTYADKKEADEVALKLDDRMDWREGGQNSYEVFDLLAEQDPDYAAAISGEKA